MAYDLPNGGPATPLAAPAARVKYTPTDKITVMAGVYSADPAGRGRLLFPAPYSNAEYKNRYGTTFNLDYGTLYIAEAAYADAKAPLPYAYKIGGWFAGGARFLDQRYDLNDLPLADPLSDGAAKRHSDDWGVYGIADQALWAPGGNDPRKVAAFARGGLSPSDRNLIDAYADGGVVLTGFVPGRSSDVLGLAATYSHISSRASGFDKDTVVYGINPLNYPTGDYELAAEATYQIVLAPWLTVQLDAQHVWHPGGNVLAPQGPDVGRVVKDESIFGIRTAVKF
jgi:porin